MASTISAATLTVSVTESITLNGSNMGATNTKTISGVNEISQRIISLDAANIRVSADGGDTFGIPYKISSGRSLGRVDLEFMDADTLLVTWLESKNQGAAWMAKTLNVKTREFSQAMLVDSVSGSRSDGFLRLSKQQLKK